MNQAVASHSLFVAAVMIGAASSCAPTDDATSVTEETSVTVAQSVVTSQPTDTVARSRPPLATTDQSEPPTGASTPATDPSAPAIDYAGEGAVQAEYFASYADLVTAADLVVLGEIVKARPGPDEGSTEYPFATVRVEIDITEVLRGPSELADSDTVESSFALGHVNDRELLHAEFQKSLPPGTAIWILRSLDDVYPGVYRIVTPASIVEPAPDGSAQPSWYRGTSEAARAGRLGPADAEQDQGARLALELSKLTFEQAIAIARQQP